MAVSPASVNAFIDRLNLSRSLDPKIREAIARHVRRALQTRCFVRFRNARAITAPHKILFLQSFLENLKIEEDEFFEYLDFILNFLGELKGKTDIFQELMTYKKLYFQGLQKAAKLDAQLSKHNELYSTLCLSAILFKIIKSKMTLAHFKKNCDLLCTT